MKTLAILFAVTASFLTQALAQVPFAGPPKVKVSKIAPAVIMTPEFQVRNTPEKRLDYLKWFEVEVEFEVDGPELVDELTFTFMIELNGKLCPGEVTHVNIPKGRGRYTVMYISPRAIDRLTQGKALVSAMIGNIWIEVKKQGQTLAKDSLKKGALPNLPQLPGLLVPKSETPFQVLWWDRYEEIKGSR